MRVLISTIGSHGDVLPFIALGREFASRGYEVIFYSNPFFQRFPKEVGIGFVPIDSVDSYYSLFNDVAESSPTERFKFLANHIAKICPAYYSAMKADVITGNTITISNSLLFASRLLNETDAVPCATIHLAPSVFQSNVMPARLSPSWINSNTPLALKQFAWRSLEKYFYNPNFSAPLNLFRSRLGLADVENIFASWIHEADCVIGMFPSWFAPPQDDWPRHAIFTGFPLYDHDIQEPLSREITTFIESGPPPVAFTAGTATTDTKQFFKSSVDACMQAGLRAILLSHFRGQLPSPLPDNVMHVDYAPFTALLPKLAAFVHHGGIGTTSQALRAGVPQLIRPVAYDQFDNASRAVQLGVAQEILPKNYTSNTVAKALENLSHNNTLRDQCRQISKNFTNNDAAVQTCDAILASLKIESLAI